MESAASYVPYRYLMCHASDVPVYPLPPFFGQLVANTEIGGRFEDVAVNS
jgi:hypothetical protein